MLFARPWRLEELLDLPHRQCGVEDGVDFTPAVVALARPFSSQRVSLEVPEGLRMDEIVALAGRAAEPAGPPKG